MKCAYFSTLFVDAVFHGRTRISSLRKGHCVLCKDVLSFVFQTFDFQFLCFGFKICVLCPVLLNGAIGT